ncbi:class I SAM-dependent methyltransferase [Shewanella sp. TC10]|uniref:class I SAM-dependent methyltransferase n=1 Tax=Shewanella sp. TC10 TaxID=1419739 RepID=UPI00129DE197|nr:class I SAM-dependent methyltransferase [Shewanella sp. TC10]
MSDHWSKYWSQGYLTSFGGAIKTNYEGKLKNYWEGKFGELNDNFSVLDIGTGNGSIPLLLNEFIGENLAGKVIGIDMANVSLLDSSTQSTVELKVESNINCENLPFESNMFDKCLSQFGIEYSDLNKSIEEVGRVLKVDGLAHFIMHNSNSTVIEINKKAYNIINSPFVDELFLNMSDLINHMGEIKSPLDIQKAKNDANCEQCRLAVNDSIKSIINIDEDAAKESELMMYIGQFFTKGMMWPVSKKIDFLSFVKNEISNQRLRLEELLSAAMDQDKIILLLQKLPISLELVSINEVKENHGVIAWEMTFRRIR